MPGCGMHSRPKFAEKARPTQNKVNNNNNNNNRSLLKQRSPDKGARGRPEQRDLKGRQNREKGARADELTLSL